MIWECYDVSVKHCHKIPSSCHILLDHPPLSQHWHHHVSYFPRPVGSTSWWRNTCMFPSHLSAKMRQNARGCHFKTPLCQLVCCVEAPGWCRGGQRSVDTWGRVTLGHTLSPVSLGWWGWAGLGWQTLTLTWRHQLSPAPVQRQGTCCLHSAAKTTWITRAI